MAAIEFDNAQPAATPEVKPIRGAYDYLSPAEKFNLAILEGIERALSLVNGGRRTLRLLKRENKISDKGWERMNKEQAKSDRGLPVFHDK